LVAQQPEAVLAAVPILPIDNDALGFRNGDVLGVVGQWIRLSLSLSGDVGQAFSLPPAFQPAFFDPGETPGKSPAAG
jgi:hypothetical protein